MSDKHLEEIKERDPRRGWVMAKRSSQRVDVAPCPVKHALRFNAEHHRKLPALQGGMWAIAASVGQLMVGVAIVGHPQSRMLATHVGELEVLRVATDGTANACSALYGACARAARAMGANDLTTTIHIDEHGGEAQTHHVKGCGTERRGCMPSCSEYDPKYDYVAGDAPPGTSGEAEQAARAWLLEELGDDSHRRVYVLQAPVRKKGRSKSK